MWLIYLLTILDKLTTILGITAALAGVGHAATFIGYLVEKTDGYSDEETIEVLAKLKRRFGIAFFIALPLAIFTPNSKQAAAIFSVGKTIEYVQSNEKIKDLPDKAIECLDKYLEEYLTDGEKK